ncbi:MAG: hypothetical protein JXJ19_02035, partial [Elusimicrobia bacterium]|nr:hypothetical protein [Elusimicrobiota bacterium]
IIILYFSSFCIIYLSFNIYKSLPLDKEYGLSFVRSAISSPSRAVLLINNLIAEKYIPDSLKKTEENKDRDAGSKNRLSELLFFILNSAAVISENKLFLILLLFVLGTVCFKKADYLGPAYIRDVSNCDYYLKWCLDFVDPVKKCINSLAQKYDINPIAVFRGNENPHFASKWYKVRVFLSAI